MRVGTRFCQAHWIFLRRDHPHACGDKRPCLLQRDFRAGSSPCVWGQVIFFASTFTFFRIIPMRVGTSVFFIIQRHKFGDHPHACGDKPCSSVPPLFSSGSSPCVWGQVASTSQMKRTSRIIPMRVGTRFSFSSVAFRCQDHPHACGDKTATEIRAAYQPGSSPCVWGQVRQAL